MFTKQALAVPNGLEKTKDSVSSQLFQGANLLGRSARPVRGPQHHNLRRLVADKNALERVTKRSEKVAEAVLGAVAIVSDQDISRLQRKLPDLRR